MTAATYIGILGFALGALLILVPMAAPAVGHWLLSMGLISGVTAERMAWGPIALFGTLIPAGIALCVGFASSLAAVVLWIRRRRAHG